MATLRKIRNCQNNIRDSLRLKYMNMGPSVQILYQDAY